MAVKIAYCLRSPSTVVAMCWASSYRFSSRCAFCCIVARTFFVRRHFAATPLALHSLQGSAATLHAFPAAFYSSRASGHASTHPVSPTALQAEGPSSLHRNSH
jgi:hypothetical protein